ncbi:unnamed protein product [Effrenium voratum]|uniref:Uncharacterized protein n=1 Tax=Effrenium voratum TaxID=2562239 RepID=A0AA36IST5_9DINO|nr:unnamed protein product [Effrenium voratum]
MSMVKELSARMLGVRIDSEDLLAELGMLLTDDGVIRRHSQLEMYELFPGDTLQLQDALQGKSVHAGVQLLRKKQLPLPATLNFLPALKASVASTVERAQYCECHTHFVGWRDSHSNLKTSADFIGLSNLAEEFREARANLVKQEEAHQCPPRRIPGFSARRAPVLAMNRGCG